LDLGSDSERGLKLSHKQHVMKRKLLPVCCPYIISQLFRALGEQLWVIGFYKLNGTKWVCRRLIPSLKDVLMLLICDDWALITPHKILHLGSNHCQQC